VPRAKVVVDIVTKGGGNKERETLRGLTTGSIKMTSHGRDRLRCVVVGDSFPCWLPHCGALGLDVVRVCLRSDAFIKIVEKLVSETCVIEVGEVPTSFPLVSVVLVDGPATTRILMGASQSQAKLVLSTTGLRRAAHGWLARMHSLSHQLLGGVTAKIQHLVVHLPAESPLGAFEPRIEGSPGRDASTVLMVNEYCHLLRRIPEPLEVFPLRCLNLGSDEWPVYHGAGLLPASLDRRTWVLTRCARAEATGKWGKRRINQLEVLLANDYPEDVAKALVEEVGATDAFVNSCPAVGCFLSGAQPWLATLVNEGGVDIESKGVGDEVDSRTKKRRMPKEMRLEADRSKKLFRPSSDQSPLATIEEEETGSLIGSVETVVDDEVKGVGDEEQQDLGSRAMKRTRKEEVLFNSSKEVLDKPSDLEDISDEFTGNGYLRHKGSSHAKRSQKSVDGEGSARLWVPKDLSKGPSHIDSELTDGLRLQNATPMKSITASRATTDAAKAIREQKAVKADDAEVPEHLWEEHLFGDSGWADKWLDDKKSFTKACKFLKSRMLLWWKKTVTRSLNNWIDCRYPHIREDFYESGQVVKLEREKYKWKKYKKSTPHYTWTKKGRATYTKWCHVRMAESCVDLVPGSDAVARAADSTWFEWDDGSRPFHWRWPGFYQRVIRDGLKVHFCSVKPRYKKSQKGTKDAAMRAKMIKKLKKVRTRRYIAPGFVTSLTSFFAVPKGEDDIRMVYDASVSGLNDSIWVPRFPLPTIQTHLRSVQEGTWMADLDIGEMFLNFVLHSDLRHLSGVDLTEYTQDVDELGHVLWEVWQRCAMGLKPSPFQAVQAMMVAEETIRGDPKDPKNPYRWDAVRMNLPGQTDYDPTLPWVSKIRLGDKCIACDVVIFVDDLRVTGPTKNEAWQAAQRAAALLNHLGIQDAPRKRRDGSQAPGAWSGCVLRTDRDGVFVYVSQEKWDKTKRLLDEVMDLITTDPTKIPRKRLEQIRGFLQYVTRTYTGMNPYLIGFHLTIDGWREDRDEDGWRQRPSSKGSPGDGGVSDEIAAMAVHMAGDEEPPVSDDPEAPEFVSAVPRFVHDIEAMMELTRSATPTLRRVRCSKRGHAFYGFYDASGRGFGATMQIGEDLIYEYGQWSSEVSEGSSSNWRELGNLVMSLENQVKQNGLRDCELFLFTDNTTAEAAFWKGCSKSPKLFELVLRLKKLEVAADLIIHVVHVAGKRMIAQGTDGLSRGDKSTGVMQRISMEQFVPLHLSALVRSSVLRPWIEAATKGLEPIFLEPEDWFTTGHGLGTFVWHPAPAAADVVVEQLGKARHKRPSSMHLIVVPRLMTGRWRRHMTRECDCYFRIPIGSTLWGKIQYEPVLIFVCLPFMVHRPNFSAKHKLLEDFRRVMLHEDLWKVSDERGGTFLRKFLQQARSLCAV
jgi:hypothetical protein